jgi:hypothetical protein
VAMIVLAKLVRTNRAYVIQVEVLNDYSRVTTKFFYNGWACCHLRYLLHNRCTRILRYSSTCCMVVEKVCVTGLSDYSLKDSLCHSSAGLNTLSPDLRYEDSVGVVGGILSQDDICSFDTVLVVDQPGVCISVPFWP